MDHWCNLQQWCNSWILGTWMVTWTVTWTRAWDDVRFPKGKWLTLLVFLLYQQAQQFCCPKTGATTSSLAQSSPSGQDSTTFWVGSSAQTTAGHKIYKPNQKQRSWRSHSFETRKIPRPCALPQQLLKVIIAASWMSIPSLRVFIQCHKSLSWVDFLCPKSIPQLLSVRSACWFCNPCWVWTLPKLLQEGSFTACSQPRTLCQSWVSPNIPIPLTP